MSVISGAAMSALQVSQDRIKVIANNIANAQTTGFKSSEVSSTDLFYNTLKKAGTENRSGSGRRPIGVQIGSGAQIDGTYRLLTQGELKMTNQPLDIAIIGAGYFAIALPNGKMGYTRDGSFKLDPATRRVVTMRGEPLDGDITIPETVTNVDTDHITVNDSGLLTAYDDQNNQVLSVQLTLWTFPNENGLEAGGNNMLLETDGSGEAVQVVDVTGKFKHAALEMSNVQYVTQLTDMLDAQRAYELGSRVIKTQDEMAKELNSIKS